jgi:hypothetical protein
MAIANGMDPANEFPLTAVSVPSVPTVYAVMVPGLGNVQGGLFGGMAELLLATNNAFPEGAKIMAAGVLPAATAFPLAVSVPADKSMLKAETDESPWVATNRAPVPEALDDELLVLQALKQSSKTGSNNPARNRNLVPIRFFLPVLSRATERLVADNAGSSRSKSTLICVSGITAKSKPRWLVGTRRKEESCPLVSRLGFLLAS